MATVNGTLKYKQDDGDIVAISPIGVDNTARKNALIAVNTIGEWSTEYGDNTITTEVKTLNTKVTNLENVHTLDLPIIGIFTEAATGPNGTITIAVPIPSVVRLLSAKGHYPTFSISGGTIGVVFEYKDPDNTIHSFLLSSVSVSDLGLFVSITGKPSLSLPIEPGAFVWSSYKQAAMVTSLHVTFS